MLRRVIEGDEQAGGSMVLCVTDINDHKITLGDGWYHLHSPLYLGSLLYKLVSSGKIKIGDKIITQGAEIVGANSTNPCHPLGKFFLLF